MGACGSRPSESSSAIDTEIRNDRSLTEVSLTFRRRNSHKQKLLLLGAGESGKSTLAKQIKLIDKPNGFRTQETPLNLLTRYNILLVIRYFCCLTRGTGGFHLAALQVVE